MPTRELSTRERGDIGKVAAIGRLPNNQLSADTVRNLVAKGNEIRAELAAAKTPEAIELADARYLYLLKQLDPKLMKALEDDSLLNQVSRWKTETPGRVTPK